MRALFGGRTVSRVRRVLSVAERRELAELAQEAASRLRAGVRASDPGVRGVSYRETAELLVSAREHFMTDAGVTDWRGQSYPYRVWVGDVYGLAGVAPEDRSRVSSALRYHVSNVLRERLDEATLESIGLRVESARQRSRELREARAATLRALTGGAVVDPVRALTAADALLERVDADDLGDLEGAERAAAVGLLGALAGRLRALRRVLPAER